MGDLIKRQDAIDACLNGFCACVSDCVDEIEKLPSAQSLNDDWEKYSDLEISEPYYTDIQVLAQLRSMYNCFDPKEEPIYHALSEAIDALKEQKTGKWIHCKYPLGECSVCHKIINIQANEAIYCPCCGSRITGYE